MESPGGRSGISWSEYIMESPGREIWDIRDDIMVCITNVFNREGIRERFEGLSYDCGRKILYFRMEEDQ